MSSPSNQTSTGNSDEEDFPIAAIICLAVGGYVIIIIAIIVIKHMLSSRGSCKSDCCQPVEEGTRPCCCSLCAKAGECCMCCGGCHVNGCLTRICGKPKKINCIDILLCNCGGCTERCCTGCSCSCDCGCLKRIKCGACCDCSCPSCSCENCCSNFCVDTSASGVCGCLCLEVKLRSPRPGSLRRSHSAPPAKGNEVKHFNTHHPPIKDKEGRVLFQRNGSGDLFKLGDASDISSSDLKLRSTSLSRSKTMGSNEAASKKVSKNVVSSLTNTPRFSDRSNGIVRKDSRGSSICSNRNTSHLNSLRSNRSTTHADNNYESNPNANRRSSRHKSLRVGRQSQRFPDKFLVSSDSVDSGIDSSHFPSEAGDKKSLSLPRQINFSKRPLPALKNVSHAAKLGRTS